MTHVLNLTDGTTTVGLGSGLMEYVPRSPDLTVLDFDPEHLQDGGERLSTKRRNVTESARVRIEGASTDAIRSTIRSIESLLRQAEEYQQRRVGSPVYVELQPDGTGDIYRSEILSGRVEVGDDALGWQWRARRVQAQVVWTRRYYWEGPEIELPLANGNGSGTGGRLIYNHNDDHSGHDNWVSITAANVPGVIPAPVRLEVLNNYNNLDRLHVCFVGLNVFSGPLVLTPILEAESGTGGTLVEDASDSGTGGTGGIGQARMCTLTDSEADLISWDLSTAFLRWYRSNWFRVLCRFGAWPTPASRVRLELRYNLTPIWRGPEIVLDSGQYLQDLGVLQLPPWDLGGTDPAPLSLVLRGRLAGGGYLTVDFLQFTALDGWLKLDSYAYGLPYGYTLVDDGISDRTYVVDGTGIRTGIFVRSGSLLLWPGRDQTLYLLHTTTVGGAPIARTSQIRVYYRPRRLTF